MNKNPHRYADFPHTYGPPKMTENHGVPGSNPGPATREFLQIPQKPNSLEALFRDFGSNAAAVDTKSV
jgi:hypothetical protein